MSGAGEILQHSGQYGWLFAPSAVLLGALHGLEPGHSKTLMAAYIVAIRGTLYQAVLLGLAATISHTAVVWVIALLGLHLGQRFNAGAVEPILQTASAAVILGIALWMIWRTWRATSARHAHHHDGHQHHDHDHDHDHDDDHDDAHAREHAAQLQAALRNQRIGNGRIIWFGLTGGLIPCPASITVLMVCLQTRAPALGMALVLCFSLGLALTLIASGIIASLSVRQAERHWQGFGALAHRAPYLSGALMLLVALYMGWTGLTGLAGLHGSG